MLLVVGKVEMVREVEPVVVVQFAVAAFGHGSAAHPAGWFRQRGTAGLSIRANPEAVSGLVRRRIRPMKQGPALQQR